MDQFHRFSRRLSIVSIILFWAFTAPIAAQKPLIPDDQDPQLPKLTCADMPDRSPCPDRDDPPNDCITLMCRAGECVSTPQPRGTSCKDTDKDFSTIAQCEANTGVCNQNAETRTLFADRDPDGVNVFDHHLAQLPKRLSSVDCCFFCERQVLEALTPPEIGNPNSRFARIGPGGQANRTKYCGIVRAYGVYDEYRDPRDILINIAPSSRYRNFAQGFATNKCSQSDPCLHTEVTPAEQFYKQDAEYLPIASGGRCSDGGTGRTSCNSRLETTASPICVYGPYVIDHGGHSVGSHPNLNDIKDDTHDHPEIHPIDATWWPLQNEDGYQFAVFQDDSNRYSEPYCGGSNNANNWSQSPRDIEFSFPFRIALDDAPVVARLDRVSTRRFDGVQHKITPLNITTSQQVSSTNEGNARRFVANNQLILEVVELDHQDIETKVNVTGSVNNGIASGMINVRVAVGCDTQALSENCTLSVLRSLNPNGQHDAGDAGSGFYYGTIRFERADRPSTIAVRHRLSPSNDSGRFNLLIDNTTVATNAGHNSQSTARTFIPGTHRVSIRSSSGTDGRNYLTRFSGACNSSGRVTLTTGQAAVCTVTNTRRSTQTQCLQQCATSHQLCREEGEFLPSVCARIRRSCEARCN